GTDLSTLSTSAGLVWSRVSDTQIVGKIGATTVVTLDLTANAGNTTATVKATLNSNYTGHTALGDDLAALGSVKVVATDTDGDTAQGTVNVTVSDDIPVALSDVGSVAEGATLTVGAAGGVLFNDKPGADGWDTAGGVVGVNNVTSGSVTTANGSGAYVIQGQYGQLTLGKDGSYTYQATAAVTSDKQDVFTYTVKDGDGDTTTAQLSITVNNVDQKPVVNDIDHSALESSRTETKSNVVLTIDLSGSMNFDSGVAGKTRLDLVKEAVAELLNSGSVNAVFITTFSSSGYATDNSALNGGQWYTAAQLQQAILAVNALNAVGGTNYDGALTSVMNYVNAAGTFPGGAGKNVSVFMSDGEPANGAVGTAKESQWITWLGSKNFSDAYAIGFGGLTSTNANNLEPIAWKAGEVQGTHTTAAQDDHVILSDVTALKDALLQTVVSPGAVVTGDLKTEGGNTSGDGWGSAVVSVVTFGAQTHTFTSASDTFTFDLGAVGKVVVKGDGTYTFTANNTTDVNAALSAALTYTLKDVDGSVSNPANLVFTLTDRSEVSSVDDSASVSTSSTMVPVTVPNTSQANFNTNDNGDWSFSSATQASFTSLATAAGGADAWLRSANTTVSSSNGADGRLTVTDNNGSSTGAGEVFTPIYTASSAGGEKLSFQVEARGNWSTGNDTAQWALYQKVGATWVALTGAGTSGSITSSSQYIETKMLDAAGQYRIYLNVTDGSGNANSNKASVSVDDFQVIHPVTYEPQWSTSSVSGNVLNNDSQGSEGASLYVGSTKVGVAGVDVVGTYGTLHLNADGSYTYTTASGAPYHATQQDVFEYHLTQADGDTATANLTITVNASGPGVLAGVVTETPVVPTPLAGHEILASTGLDTLVGTGSDDLFTWKSGTQSAPVDVVKGFGTAGSDKLVLGDLLQGEEHTSDLSKFLHLETQAGTGGTVNTVIKVSTSGGLAADGSGYNQQIVVEGVDLTGSSHDQNTMIKNLIDQGKLKLDHS
ncbi:type I secretion C-terminal target domain-containing protein, partial [Comamonas sp. CMM02]|uniref:type I secretion C-terminal target domain-containing protein n=1 Tax=Comamonas sp. CMM02 TaxID=2769307 RepID=UPI001781D94D